MKVRAIWFSTGLLSGAVLAFAIGGAKLSVEREAHASKQQKQEQIAQSRETLLSQEVIRSESTIKELEERLSQRDQEISSVREQLAQVQGKLDQSGLVHVDARSKIKTLTEEVDVLNRTLVLLNRLYGERYDLLQQMTALNGELAKSKADTERFKTACEKYKSGTSWDWVSEEDCDSFNASLNLYNGHVKQYQQLTDKLMSVQKQIDGHNTHQGKN